MSEGRFCVFPPNSNMTLVALNVRNGDGSRVAAICQFLEGYHSDVIVLTEWRYNGSGREFIAWMESRGLSHAALNDGSTPNGVCVAAHSPFESTSMTPADSPGALMLVRFQDWTLLASYFPQHRAKGRFFSACKEIAAVHAETPFVILGDLNPGNQLADKSPSGAPYACAEGFDALRLEAGLVDLWGSSNGPDACEWTWLSSQKKGFRIDHAFGNEPFARLLQPTCVYDHRSREEKTSDHSALIVTASDLPQG
jgi:exonuclease III